MTFDRTLIDPTPAAFEEALKEASVEAAVATASADNHPAILRWWQEEISGLRPSLNQNREGTHFRHQGRGLFRVAWAVDYRERKLIRIEAGGEPGVAPLSDASTRLPLAVVLREHVVFFWANANASPELLLACSCGALGGPAEIAWMDDRCGPCHDRTAGGEPLPEPFAVHEHELLVPWSARFAALLAWSPDRRWLVLGSRNVGWGDVFREAVVVRLPEGSVRLDRAHRRLDGGGGVVGADFTTDGQRIVLLCREGADALIRVHDLRKGKMLATIPLRGSPNRLVVAPEPDTAYASSSAGTFRVDLSGRLPTQSVPAAVGPFRRALVDGGALGLACSPDGRWLGVANRDWFLLRERPRDEVVALESSVLLAGGGSCGLVFAPDSSMLIAAGRNGEIALYEVPSLRCRGWFQAAPRPARRLFFDDPWLTVAPHMGSDCRRWPWLPLLEFVRLDSRSAASHGREADRAKSS
jgi:hypothetical protein